MTSINTNLAAVSALRTLQQSNAQLDATQGRISTGLKIGEAKDNAAYWSISTSLKSDNKAMATVKDALGLGAATVDTAYQGLNSTIDVLNEIKSKLTAATQDGVDKTKIQSEISELQKQLKSIANSSTFSGSNLLSVDSSVTNYSATTTVVASFTRNADGSVAIGTIGVDGSSVKLYDASTNATGTLDTRSTMYNSSNVALNYGGLTPAGASGNTSSNGLEDKSAVASAAVATKGTVATYSATVLDSTNYLTFAVNIDGTSHNVVLDGTTHSGDINSQADFVLALQAGIDAAFGASKATVANSGTGFKITSATAGNGSIVTIGPAVQTGTVANYTDLGTTTTVGVQAAATFTTTDDVASTTLDTDDAITFNIALNGGEAKTVRIDRALINTALNANDGNIADITEMKTVVNAALAKAGVTGVTVGNSTNKLTFTSNNTTGTSQVVVSNTRATAGASVMSVDDIDITQLAALGAISGSQQREVLSSYISIVNDAINKVTSSAATLGSVASRIDLQKTFVQNLMDTIDKGVSGLVDADMNEESTKLQALQVKQSLGVQALSIANQSAQNVLRLFQ